MQVLIEPLRVFSDTTLNCVALLFESVLLWWTMIHFVFVTEHLGICVWELGEGVV